MSGDSRRTALSCARRTCVLVLLIGCVMASRVYAQRGGRGGGPGPGASARAAAPKDFTGYWVSIVTEQWHLRMMVPPKGDYSLLPLNVEGRRVADAWNPAKDQTEGDQCKAYGAPAIMRMPARLHIHWADDNTLQVDVDSGTQTRLFRFGSPSLPISQPLQWQGSSVAVWEGQGGRGRGPAARGSGPLRVTTTRMRSGYLRRNGVLYSDNAVLEEYFETFTEPNGDGWLVVTSVLTDPQYLTGPYAYTVPFKKIADGSGWDPTSCRVDQPR